MQKDAAEVATYEDKIQQALKNSVAEDPEVIRLRAKVTQLDDLLAKLRREKPILERKVRDAEEALAQANDAEGAANGALLSATSAEKEMSDRIANLKSQSTNRMNAFGNNIQAVILEIDRAHWVKGRPLGPLGMHVKLEDSRYIDAFHSVLAPTLCSFAVKCDQDRRTMASILDRCSKTR